MFWVVEKNAKRYAWNGDLTQILFWGFLFYTFVGVSCRSSGVWPFVPCYAGAPFMVCRWTCLSLWLLVPVPWQVLAPPSYAVIYRPSHVCISCAASSIIYGSNMKLEPKSKNRPELSLASGSVFVECEQIKYLLHGYNKSWFLSGIERFCCSVITWDKNFAPVSTFSLANSAEHMQSSFCGPEKGVWDFVFWKFCGAERWSLSVLLAATSAKKGQYSCQKWWLGHRLQTHLTQPTSVSRLESLSSISGNITNRRQVFSFLIYPKLVKNFVFYSQKASSRTLSHKSTQQNCKLT